jgi:hypothetical protein
MAVNEAGCAALSAYQCALLDAYRELLGEAVAQPELQWARFAATPDCAEFGGQLAVFRLPHEDAGPDFFVLSLGDSELEAGAARMHEHQYLWFVDEMSDAVIKAVCGLRRLDLCFSSVIPGTTVPLSKIGASSLADIGAQSVGVWPTEVLLEGMTAALHRFREALNNVRPTSLFMVTPLSGQEAQTMREGGLDELLRTWSITELDFVRLRRF